MACFGLSYKCTIATRRPLPTAILLAQYHPVEPQQHTQIAPMVVLSRLLPLLLPISGCQSLSNHHTRPFCSNTGCENYSRYPNTDGKSPPCSPTKSLVSSSKNSSAGRTALLVDRTGGGEVSCHDICCRRLSHWSICKWMSYDMAMVYALYYIQCLSVSDQRWRTKLTQMYQYLLMDSWCIIVLCIIYRMKNECKWIVCAS
jgi:hypothetical protein